MATTRIIPMHINKGKTIAQCMKARIDYVKNPDKTEDGEFISSYACAPESADQEFVLARNQYLMNAGSGKKNEVIAYQLRQSFKPGEVSAEEANKIGYELAERLLHGEHAFIVATHTDRRHVHNHIVFCATALECSHKFRNVWNSSRLVAEISDELCREHHLSVVQNPQNITVSYDKWEGDQSNLTSRDSLRITIDEALRMQPDGFDALMQLMEEAGCWIKRRAHISIKPPGGERYIRLDSLGAEYSEEKLRQVLDGHHVHIPKIPRSEYNYSQVKRLIDVDAKLREGKGKGYMIWAERNNIDAKAQSIIFLKEHNIGSVEELEEQINVLRSDRNKLYAAIREKKNRMKEINELRQAIRDYRRTKDVYAQYKASGWSPKFYNEHRQDIESHKKSQAVYSSVDGKMPTLKELSTEYDTLKAEKETDDATLEELKPQLTTLNHIKYNFDVLERDYLPEEKDLRREEHQER